MPRNPVTHSILVLLFSLPLLSCGASVCFTETSPQITSITPGIVASGSSSVQVIVVGSNFSDGTVLVFNDGTQLAPVTITPTRMTFNFSAVFFNGVGVIQFHLSDGCRGTSNTVGIRIV